MKMSSIRGLSMFVRHYDDVDPFADVDFNINVRTSDDECTFNVLSADVENEDSNFLADNQQQKTPLGKSSSIRLTGNPVICFVCVLIGLQVIGGVGAMNCMDIEIMKKVGDDMIIPLYWPNEGHLDFCNFVTKRYESICYNRTCDNSPHYSINGFGSLCFTVSNVTVGNYSMTDCQTNKVVCSFQVTLQRAADHIESRASMLNLPNVLLIAFSILVVLDYFI